MITEKEAGSSMTTCLRSCTKNTPILCMTKLETQAQAEFAMKVNVYIFVNCNFWCEADWISMYHIIQSSLTPLYLLFFFQRFLGTVTCLCPHILPIRISPEVILRNSKNLCNLVTTDLLERSFWTFVLLRLLSTWNKDPGWTGASVTPTA